MNNKTSIIMHHKVNWFLTNLDTNILLYEWEKSIKNFICQGYKEGQFEIEYKDNLDFLTWAIVKE